MGAATSMATAAIWVFLAWRTPTSTFHFAPFVAGLAGPYVASTVGQRAPARTALAVTAGCAAALTVALIVLAGADKLQGPTFWSEDGAALEAVLFGAVGLAVGFVSLWQRHQPPPAHESQRQAEQRTT